MLTLALVPMLAWHISLQQDAARRSGIEPYRVEWENDDVRIARVVLAPGEHASAESPSGSVIVYLTANLDGRMPSADATWQAAGPFDMENRGRARFEALIIQFKRTVPASMPSPASPSSYAGRRTMAPTVALTGYGYPYANWIDYAYREPVKSETLVDTAGVTVTRVRQPASMYQEPAGSDANDRIVVYLRGGYAWPVEGSQGQPGSAWYDGPERVHRGEVRVLPANTPYPLSNPGGDRSEFIIVARR
jgi:hypothetical protein